jgi:hypothetical protein
MDRTTLYTAVALSVTLFGLAITLGALLGELGLWGRLDGDSLLVGAGIAVAGAGALTQLWSEEPKEGAGPESRTREDAPR